MINDTHLSVPVHICSKVDLFDSKKLIFGCSVTKLYHTQQWLTVVSFLTARQVNFFLKEKPFLNFNKPIEEAKQIIKQT